MACATLFLTVSSFAQVKNYVGVVRETHYPAYDEFLDDLGKTFKSHGYNTYAEYVDAYRKGGFGSGFVYVDAEGNNYIITNRHVVSQMASASIEFEGADGGVTKYDNLSMFITDDDIDLAILRFEGNAKPFKTGLPLFEGKLADGQDVQSAGYPGLMGEPVWQFGKGSVTNASARIKDMIDPTISTVIQHSAQIDAGNSGGPLLVASKNAADGYEVVGINTWKAVGRDATNFAIPAKLAIQLIEKAKKPADDATLKADRVAKFKAALTESTNDYTAIVKFISYDMASKQGEASFEEILKHGSTAVRNRIASEFSYNPMEGLRYAVAYTVYKDFSAENATDEKLTAIDWQKEHGLYRISSVKVEEPKKTKVAKDSKKTTSKKPDSKGNKVPEISFNGLGIPYQIGLSAGGFIPTSVDKDEADLKGGFDLTASVFPGENGMFGVVFGFERLSAVGKDFNAFGFGACFRIPLDFTLFCVSPNASAGFRMCGGGDPSLLQGFWQVGVETTFDLGVDYIRPGIGLGYRKAGNSFTFTDNRNLDTTVNSSNLALTLTLGFLF